MLQNTKDRNKNSYVLYEAFRKQSYIIKGSRPLNFSRMEKKAQVDDFIKSKEIWTYDQDFE